MSAEEARRRIEDARVQGSTALDLSGLGLSSLPPELGQLSGLTTLDLDGNRLSSLPPELGQLSGLTELNLDRNQLSSLPPELGQLSGLTALYLGHNRLSSLPPELGRLSGLTALDLGHNQLSGLPPELGQLSGLIELYLSGNRLSSLPPELGQLSGLTRLDLRGNPGLGLPVEVVGGNRDGAWPNVVPGEVLAYYFRTQHETRRRLNEAKVLVVGQGAVGKTSLIKRLLHDRFDPGETKTEGIDIAPWSVPSRDGEAIRVNVWDFGGQEIMHATHQFFLTKRSLYVVVLDARKGENEGNLHYWLKIIQSFGGDSPVLVVTNKCETHALQLNQTRLAKDYAPNLKAFFKTSCQTGAGIAQLRGEIERWVDSLEHVRDELPHSYFTVKARLEELARERDYLEVDEYRALCCELGLAEPEAQEHLLRFLHDLGSVLHFDDPGDPLEVRDTNVLNPEWVTGGVYTVLNSPNVSDWEGVLDRRELDRVMDRARYPRRQDSVILGMMAKFELCFPFHGQRHLLLIPELLPKNEPELPWAEAWALRFEYHYPVLPPGLICRFIVRMRHHLPASPIYWRSGVVLEFEEGVRALVRADTAEARIFVSVFGPQGGARRRALAVVRSCFAAIHRTVPRLIAEEMVPLPDDPEHVVPYAHLIALEQEGHPSFMPYHTRRSYSVRGLLEGVDEPGSRFLELAPYDWTLPESQELHQVLVKAYPDRAAAGLLLTKAGLPESELPPFTAADAFWQAAINALAHKGCLVLAVEGALADARVSAFRPLLQRLWALGVRFRRDR